MQRFRSAGRSAELVVGVARVAPAFFQAPGCVPHQDIVSGCPEAPGGVCRFASNVPTGSSSAAKAAGPKLRIEYGPGIGPSASRSVLT